MLEKPSGKAQASSWLVACIYGAWLLPPCLGAVFGWAWWVVYLLMLPGVIWYAATEGVRYYEKVTKVDPGSPLIYRAPMLVAVLPFVVLADQSGRFSGIGAAAGLVLIDVLQVRVGMTERRRLALRSRS